MESREVHLEGYVCGVKPHDARPCPPQHRRRLRRCHAVQCQSWLLLRLTTMGQRTTATSLGIHVNRRPRNNLGLAPISDHQLPARPGDNTPRIMDDWGQKSCRA
jgi:hypothetical protein